MNFEWFPPLSLVVYSFVILIFFNIVIWKNEDISSKYGIFRFIHRIYNYYFSSNLDTVLFQQFDFFLR